MFHLRVSEDTDLKLENLKPANELFQLISQNKSHLEKWLPWVKNVNSIDDSISFLDQNLRNFRCRLGFSTLIFFKGQIAGVIGFHDFDRANKATSIGYWLADMYTGKGIMTNSCRAMTKYAFEDRDINRIEIRCAFENVKSRAVPQRLEFVEESIAKEALRVQNEFHDVVVYRMLKREWINKSKL